MNLSLKRSVSVRVILELVAEAQLQNPRETAARGDQPERAAADVGVRAAELRGVRQVQNLEPYGPTLTSGEGESLREHRVGILPELIAIVAVRSRRVPESAEPGIRIAGRADPRR